MLTLSPVRSLVKLPVPLPSLVLLSFTVGFGLVLQQTPLAVMAAPPSSVILPPHFAVDSVISLTFDVDTMPSRVVKLVSSP